jgi:uncharacterized protein YkwD
MRTITYIIIVILFFITASQAQDTLHSSWQYDSTKGVWYSKANAVVLPDFSYKIDLDMYDRVNEIRAEHGLPPLVRSKEFEASGAEWLKKMHIRHYKLTHDPAFNKAELLTNCSDPITCWMRSTPHRRVLIARKYKKIGIVYLDGDWIARLE